MLSEFTKFNRLLVMKSTARPAKSIKQKESGFKLNLLLFEYERNPFPIGFYKSEQGKKLHRLNKMHWPNEIVEKEKQDYLYTDFTDKEDADYRVTIKPGKENRLFLKAYYQECILKYIRKRLPKAIINRNFVNNPEIWVEVHSENQPGNGIKRFDVFGLNMSVGGYSEDKPELMISYKGMSDVFTKSIFHFQAHLKEVTRVVNKIPELKLYKDVIAYGGHNLRDYYPVVNKYFQDTFPIDSNYRRVDSRYDEASDKINAFYSRVFQKPDFHEFTGLVPKNFYRPLKEQVGRVDISNHQMIFGGGKSHTNPYKGLMKFGPARSVSVNNPMILVIVPKGKEHVADIKLIRPFMHGASFYKGVSALTNIPFKLIEEPVTYSNLDDPHDEVMNAIKKRGLQSHNNIMAFFFSSIPPDAPLTKKRKFYRTKESLLKHGFQVQGVNMQKLESVSPSAINWWHGPLCAAVLAKMGGIPWTSGADNKKDLVIGIGAFMPRWSPGRFVGSSVCFDDSGTFRGFDFFDHENPRLLAGSLKKAVQQYIREKKHLERVVIHYYKEMSKEEEKPIWNAINSIQPDVPVYVVSINKTMHFDEVILDKKAAGKMPVSGTYIHLKHDQYLLFNNERLTKDKQVKKFPFPVKMRIREIWSSKKREKVKNMTEEEKEKAKKIPDAAVHDLMAQIIRFSRMYWKSVKPQPLPVTIAYPTMMAEQVPYFDETTIPHSTRHLPFFL